MLLAAAAVSPLLSELLQKFTWNCCTTTYKKFTKSAETFVVQADFTTSADAEL